MKRLLAAWLELTSLAPCLGLRRGRLWTAVDVCRACIRFRPSRQVVNLRPLGHQFEAATPRGRSDPPDSCVRHPLRERRRGSPSFYSNGRAVSSLFFFFCIFISNYFTKTYECRLLFTRARSWDTSPTRKRGIRCVPRLRVGLVCGRSHDRARSFRSPEQLR